MIIPCYGLQPLANMSLVISDPFTHFRLVGANIEPRTEIGEATVQLLRLNAPDRVLQRLALQQIDVYPAS